MTPSPNPFLSLQYEPAFESLGADYSDVVAAADFPQHTLRFRNDSLLETIGLDPAQVADEDFVEAFGRFHGRSPLLAMRYHGHQFGVYNPYLGDGRGFLYGQVWGRDGNLYDFGTKGSGTTPYSRGGDGRLTLKGGVREAIAAEALHAYGVNTSRCLSLVETGESLWRGDEPSPTRSCVMVRFSHSHIRFGTFERLHYHDRPDLATKLLDHIITYYYPHLQDQADAYPRFYAELVQRTATLVAQWMAVGFCHAVLNTDNMSITGESFDYGPYAFIQDFNPRFTAAYFDDMGRYSYSNQPRMCRWNLETLLLVLKYVIPAEEMEAGLAEYESHYQAAYRRLMLNKLGFADLPPELADDLIAATLQLLFETKVIYHDFFLRLRRSFAPRWQTDRQTIPLEALIPDPGSIENNNVNQCFDQWQRLYYAALGRSPQPSPDEISRRLAQHNPDLVPIRAEIEAIWEPIVTEDNWEPFYGLIKGIRSSVG
ncbi:MAG: YdiU family protein [Synechococcales bacterium]|nr:YdiU family protein [Synechococcales bacterium]